MRISRGCSRSAPPAGREARRHPTTPWSSLGSAKLCCRRRRPRATRLQMTNRRHPREEPGLYRCPARGFTSSLVCPPLGSPTPCNAGGAFALSSTRPADWSRLPARQRIAALLVSGRAPLTPQSPTVPSRSWDRARSSPAREPPRATSGETPVSNVADGESGTQVRCGQGQFRTVRAILSVTRRALDAPGDKWHRAAVRKGRFGLGCRPSVGPKHPHDRGDRGQLVERRSGRRVVPMGVEIGPEDVLPGRGPARTCPASRD